MGLSSTRRCNACQCDCTDSANQLPARIDSPMRAPIRDAWRVIASFASTLAFLMVVAVAGWIVISSGAGHPTWQ
jgi:hypothetical protein